MRRRWIIAVLLGCLAVGFALEARADAGGCESRACERRVAEKQREVRESCRSRACKRRVCVSQSCRARVAWKAQRKRWRAAVNAYGPGLLAARRQCESGNHGLYRANTGNGFYGAYQFDRGSWRAAGGSTAFAHLAAPLEQDYRAVVWDGMHGGDLWPNCP